MGQSGLLRDNKEIYGEKAMRRVHQTVQWCVSVRVLLMYVNDNMFPCKFVKKNKKTTKHSDKRTSVAGLVSAVMIVFDGLELLLQFIAKICAQTTNFTVFTFYVMDKIVHIFKAKESHILFKMCSNEFKNSP